MIRSPQSDQEPLADIDFESILMDREDKAAVLFKINGKDHWLPRSQIEIDRGGKVVTMPEWLAMNHGLI